MQTKLKMPPTPATISSLIADVVTGQIDVRDVEIPDYEQVEETLYKSDDNDTLQSEDEIPEEV